ncbi:MAG: GNAT family N-acetyltransferase [Bacillota bacterium]
MEPTLQLRVVQKADEPFLYELYASTRQAEVDGWGWTPAQQEGFLRMQFQARSRSYAWQFPGADQRVLWLGEERIGQLLVERTDREIRLIDIALLPAHQGRGIGAGLIRALQQEAQQSGRPLRLSVVPTNPARLLYERLGFTTVADDGLYRAMEWRPESGE